ncbi:MAG: outer membrane protein assembly factor BamC [Gammaproteobacteria bacterium]|nr:outer membrane protein assembly factor BamC [Gammaproteobacteria bacterium]
MQLPLNLHPAKPPLRPLYRYPCSILLLASLSAALAGCGSAPKTINGESLPPLELPPGMVMADGIDLLPIPTDNSHATSSRACAESEALLPAYHGITLQGSGSERWLSVATVDAALWPHLENFWERAGFKLTINRPAYGIIETYWHESNDERFVTPQRDKFRMRLEQVDNHSEIYLSHYGASTASKATIHEEAAWQQRPRDSALEAEYLQRLALFLGERTPPALIDQNSQEYPLEGGVLTLPIDFDRAWRKVGMALDRSGSVINDRNRAAGIYYVEELNLLDDIDSSPGWFSSTFGGKQSFNTPLQVIIKGSADNLQSEVRLQGAATPEQAERILKTIRQGLK